MLRSGEQPVQPGIEDKITAGCSTALLRVLVRAEAAATSADAKAAGCHAQVAHLRQVLGLPLVRQQAIGEQAQVQAQHAQELAAERLRNQDLQEQIQTLQRQLHQLQQDLAAAERPRDQAPPDMQAERAATAKAPAIPVKPSGAPASQRAGGALKVPTAKGPKVSSPVSDEEIVRQGVSGAEAVRAAAEQAQGESTDGQARPHGQRLASASARDASEVAYV